jgi:hypothetical protein
MHLETIFILVRVHCTSFVHCKCIQQHVLEYALLIICSQEKKFTGTEVHHGQLVTYCVDHYVVIRMLLESVLPTFWYLYAG